VDERVRFIAALREADEPFAVVCKRFEISRKTGYKWLARYEQGGPAEVTCRQMHPRFQQLLRQCQGVERIGRDSAPEGARGRRGVGAVTRGSVCYNRSTQLSTRSCSPRSSGELGHGSTAVRARCGDAGPVGAGHRPRGVSRSVRSRMHPLRHQGRNTEDRDGVTAGADDNPRKSSVRDGTRPPVPSSDCVPEMPGPPVSLGALSIHAGLRALERLSRTGRPSASQLQTIARGGYVGPHSPDGGRMRCRKHGPVLGGRDRGHALVLSITTFRMNARG